MIDILLEDNNGDLADITIDNTIGDFAIGDSEAQHILLLLDTTKGDWTQSPLAGVGVKKWIKGVLNARFEREVKLQLEADGLIDFKIEIDGNQVFIDKK